MKPPECRGCVLETRGTGFAPPYGNPESPLVVIAEALGANEARQGKPLVGEAGVYWQRALARLGLEKDDLFIGNTVNCQPPGNWLTGAPYENSAIGHCRSHRSKFYTPQAKVYLTMGVVATRTVLKEVLDITYMGELESWHSYVIGPKPHGPFVVPTFHPSYILQGNHDLFGAFLFAIKRAAEVASFGVQPEDDCSLVVDPPVAWFLDYVNQIPDDPEAWLAVDVETHNDRSLPGHRLVRVNLSMHPNQGVSVPFEERYRFALNRALYNRCTKIFWNERFDLKELAKDGGIPINGETIDAMWAWHMLQSALPKSLGFVAPFYSNIEPWKHLSLSDPGRYAAIDAVQTIRIMLGLKRDLEKSGQWQSFMRYATLLDHQALYPMEEAGILVDKKGLEAMLGIIDTGIADISKLIEQHVPADALPLEGGWKKQPIGYPNAFLAPSLERVIVCRLCNMKDVTPGHRCKP